MPATSRHTHDGDGKRAAAGCDAPCLRRSAAIHLRFGLRRSRFAFGGRECAPNAAMPLTTKVNRARDARGAQTQSGKSSALHGIRRELNPRICASPKGTRSDDGHGFRSHQDLAPLGLRPSWGTGNPGLTRPGLLNLAPLGLCRGSLPRQVSFRYTCPILIVSILRLFEFFARSHQMSRNRSTAERARLQWPVLS